MFAARGSVSDTIPQSATTPADASETQARIDADWIDEQGNAYNYRDDVISILFMGIDYMGDEKNWFYATESNGGNADVIGLVILDTRTFDFSMLYIPRDTMADVIAMDANGQYLDTVYTNISTAHSYGDGKDLSCRLTTDAVSRLLYGAPVSRYVALDYDALYTLNDLIGGLTITFDDDYTEIHSTFTKGSTVTLNRWYMDKFITYRSETDLEGAYKRGMRSMAVMKALFNQCKDEIVADPRRGAGILQRPEGLHHHRSGPDGDYVSGAEHGEDVLHLGHHCASPRRDGNGRALRGVLPGRKLAPRLRGGKVLRPGGMIGNKAAPPNRRAALDSQQAQQDNLLCLFL